MTLDRSTRLSLIAVAGLAVLSGCFGMAVGCAATGSDGLLPYTTDGRTRRALDELRAGVRAAGGGARAADQQLRLTRAYLDLYAYAVAVEETAWLAPHFSALGVAPRPLRFDEDLLPLLTFIGGELNRLERLIASAGVDGRRFVRDARRFLGAERSRLLTGDEAASLAALRALSLERGPLANYADLHRALACRRRAGLCDLAFDQGRAALGPALERARRDLSLAPLVERLSPTKGS